MFLKNKEYLFICETSPGIITTEKIQRTDDFTFVNKKDEKKYAKLLTVDTLLVICL